MAAKEVGHLMRHRQRSIRYCFGKLKRREANLVGKEVRKKSCDHVLITLVCND